MREDPLDLLTSAADDESQAIRIAGYWRVLEVLEQSDGEWGLGYVESVSASAMCGLARDGEVPVEAAVAQVDRAVAAGAPCVALYGLIDMYWACGHWHEVLDAAKRVPKSCFRSDERAMRRFQIWDRRAAAAANIGRPGECLRWAARIVDWMERDDPRDLEWVPPWRTVEALLTTSADEGRWAPRATELLAEMSRRVDLEDWFLGDMVARISAALAR